MGSEQRAYEDALARGTVTPKTYESLFAKKDTLPKIASIFGLLLSGAGSGLAHQSNAMLDAMNKEITNDLEAQKVSKENVQNFYKLHQNDQMNKAHQKLMGTQGAMNEANARNIYAEAAMKSYTLARMHANSTALHSLVQEMQKMPPGSPQREAAMQQLGILSPQVQGENFNLQDRAATAGAYYRVLGLGGGEEQNFQKEQQARMMMGPQGEKIANWKAERHIEDVPGEATRPIPEHEREALQSMQVLDNKGKDLLAFIKQNKGTLNPQTRAVAAQKLDELKNYYNDSIKGGALTEGRLGWYDQQFGKGYNPTSLIGDLFGNTAKLEEVVNSNKTRMGTKLGTLGFKQPAQSQTKQPPIERKDPKTGRTVLYDAETKKPLGFK
jgi:hypothetical protein